MKSRISIKADFEKNTPYILIEQSKSDDTRDELIEDLFRKLGYTSSWFRVEFMSYENNADTRVKLFPVTPDQLAYEGKQMIALDESLKEGSLVERAIVS